MTRSGGGGKQLLVHDAAVGAYSSPPAVWLGGGKSEGKSFFKS